jgi:hypothetical protein
LATCSLTPWSVEYFAHQPAALASPSNSPCAMPVAQGPHRALPPRKNRLLLLRRKRQYRRPRRAQQPFTTAISLLRASPHPFLWTRMRLLARSCVHSLSPIPFFFASCFLIFFIFHVGRTHEGRTLAKRVLLAPGSLPRQLPTPSPSMSMPNTPKRRREASLAHSKTPPDPCVVMAGINGINM